MADYDLKSIAADTDGPSADTELLFGAPDQSSGTPKPYSFAGIKIWVKSWIAKADVGLSNIVNPTNAKVGANQVAYISGNWYLPHHHRANGSGSAPGLGSIRLHPILIRDACTITDLGISVTTLAASQNVQLAIYANNASTGRPTGNALSSTGSISTAATGRVSAALGASVGISAPGLYWLASNCDSATPVFTTADVSQCDLFPALIGNSSLTALWAFSSSLASGVSVAQAFGTWPDLTSASFTLITTNSLPLIAYKVA